MPRDQAIETIFTATDDAMRAVWGLHTYMEAAVEVAERRNLLGKLPDGSFQLTHEWSRLYDRNELLNEMDQLGESVHCRASLLVLVSLFEAATRRFYGRLVELNRAEHLERENYKRLLKWAFKTVQQSAIASPKARDRLPETCGDVDNARRLRNTIVHYNGRYDEKYVADAIDDGWVKVQYERGYEPNVRLGNPIVLRTDRYEYFSCSHIELLHILHNTIQSRFFGHNVGYNYAEKGKKIEWRRVLGA
ncbi:MAG: hypothetical protein LAO04_19705 [Acidobacteriia bacterium]|nr:hypothetical protein [Terriglobia bacterium]